MNTRRWIALSFTFLGIVALAWPQFGHGQGDPNKEPKESKDKDMPPLGKGKEGPGLGPPQPGVILPVHLQNELRFSPEQKKALADLQKEVDARLAKILTEEQKNILKDLRERGPGIFDPRKKDREKGRP